MNKASFVLALTEADLVALYGDTRALRTLILRMQRAGTAEERLEMLLQFEDADWLLRASTFAH